MSCFEISLSCEFLWLSQPFSFIQVPSMATHCMSYLWRYGCLLYLLMLTYVSTLSLVCCAQYHNPCDNGPNCYNKEIRGETRQPLWVQILMYVPLCHSCAVHGILSNWTELDNSHALIDGVFTTLRLKPNGEHFSNNIVATENICLDSDFTEVC